MLSSYARRARSKTDVTLKPTLENMACMDAPAASTSNAMLPIRYILYYHSGASANAMLPIRYNILYYLNGASVLHNFFVIIVTVNTKRWCAVAGHFSPYISCAIVRRTDEKFEKLRLIHKKMWYTDTFLKRAKSAIAAKNCDSMEFSLIILQD